MHSRDRPPVRRSVEVEYWVIDEEGRLTDPGTLVDASPGAEREFVKPLLEIKTTPCETTAELRQELLGRIRSVLQRAEDIGKTLVPLATPLNHQQISELPSDRTRIQNHVVGAEFQYVRHCAGTHIHFEQQPGHEIDQLNTLIALDPALALVNSAQHFRGEKLAHGARSKLYRRMAYENLPHQGQLWPYVSDRAEWDQRLESRYREFMQRALDAGVERSAVESCFDPESAVWTPVKFRDEFGTVEWRSPDATLPTRIIQLADAMAAIVGRVANVSVQIGGPTGMVGDTEIVLPEFDRVMDHVNAAIRDGLSSGAVRSYLSRMGFDASAYEPLSDEMDGLTTISRTDARQLRVEYAERLRQDVATVDSMATG